MERVEDDLIKKEITLEAKLKHESWGEEGDDHSVKMHPLVPHTPRLEFGFKRHFNEMKRDIERRMGSFFHSDHERKSDEHGILSSMFHRSV
jgi:hypothetical protein